MLNKSNSSNSKTILIVLGVVVILVIVVNALLSNSSNIDNTYNDSSSLNQDTDSSVNNALDEVAAPQAKTYSLNEPFNLSGYAISASDSGNYSWENIAFTLTKRGAFTALRGNTVTPKQGNFYIVFASAKNTGNEKQDLGFSVLYNSVLVDDKGNRFSNDDTTDLVYMIQYNWGYFSDYHEQRSVNPNLQAKDFIAFDVPNGNYKLCDKDNSTFCINLQ